MNTFLSYGSQFIDQDDINAVVNVLKSDYLTQGPAIKEFEKSICDYTGACYCVAVANGTAALHIAVSVLELDQGKDGITSPISFVASSNCMLYNHLKPVFADIDTKTYNINPEEIKKRINKITKLIIPVHFAGQAADMKKIHQIARDNNMFILEDAAHAIGSKYDDGSYVGNCRYSDMTIFSFHPVKTITTGEGGAITTNQKELYEKLLMMRSHGITRDAVRFVNKGDHAFEPWYYEMRMLGYNYRMTDIQAALGISQMKKLDYFSRKRREIVEKYNNAFRDIDYITIPFENKELSSCFHLYVIQIDFQRIGKSRSEVMRLLRENNIGTQVHYIPVHTQPFYMEHFGYKWGDFPVAENYYQRALSLPLFPRMSDDDIERVIDAVSNLE